MEYVALDERAWLIRGDMREALLNLGKVSAVISDPPYGDVVHQEERAARDRSGQVTAVPIEFSPLEPEAQRMLTAYCAECLAGWAVLFMQAEQLNPWIAEFANWQTSIKYVRPMVWVKTNARPNFSGNGPGMGFEMMGTWHAGGGRRRWNGRGKVGVFNCYNRRRTGAHQTEKPIELMRELVSLFSNPGDVVLDPFMGSGTTGVACLELDRRFIGIERDPKYFEMAVTRMEEAASLGHLYDLAVQPKEQSLVNETRYRRAKRGSPLVL